MRNHTLLICFVLFLIYSCGTKTVTDASSQDEKLDSFKVYYVEELFRISPDLALSAGRHDYDSVLTIPSIEMFGSQVKRWNSLLDSLKLYKDHRLNDANRIDLKMMADYLQSNIWYVNEFRNYEWNPAIYNACGSFAEILSGSYAPLDERLNVFHLRLKNVKLYYDNARLLVKNPTIEHTDLAILQNQGSVEEVFGPALQDSVNNSGLLPERKTALLAAADSARQSVLSYVAWLTEIRLRLTADNSRTFRIGKELFEAKFRHDIVSAFSAEEIYNKALARRTELHTEMAALSRELWPRYFRKETMPSDSLLLIRKVIDALSGNHVKPEMFLSAIEGQIPELIAFINQKNLLYIDPSKPLIVRKTPAYLEGSGAGVSISAPGPFDKNANTYYNVSLLTGYTAAQAESYLREYNHYILQILNIHEAIPGHYTQLVYSNNSPSIIKSMFGNGAMIEGWAVYTERMMLENGYGGNSPEMWLMYYKWHLRSVCNTILDYGVHVLNMREEEARKLLVEGAFQQEAEVDGKWKRVKLSQVQLCSYFTGYTEIYELREQIKMIQGDQFDLKAFHEKFLSYGSAPVKYIRELMLPAADANATVKK